MSKDKGRIVEEVFTPTGKRYKVKCNVVLDDLKQALALRAIITSFETSPMLDSRFRKYELDCGHTIKCEFAYMEAGQEAYCSRCGKPTKVKRELSRGNGGKKVG